VRFGTDGLRGRVDAEITEDVAYRLGRAVAATFVGTACVIGADTRESSPRLGAAVASGLVDGGSVATNLGVITTPGVAVIARERGAVGVMVSASHNPYHDNGLKVLGLGGEKLDDETQSRVQQNFDAAPSASRPAVDLPVDATGAERYLEIRQSAVRRNGLVGQHLVLDCANGAASHLAPTLFRSLGADVTVINANPDGTNINLRSGSTHPHALTEKVRAVHADLGLAFDGDADRCVAVDAHGVTRDGDDLMVLFAEDLHDRHELGGTVVVTHMSNLGLHRAMREARIDVIETDVGDRNVLRALEERDLPFGGEQSGHLVFRRLAPTGDGMLTGLLLCELLSRRGRLHQLADAAWMRVPQRLISVPSESYDDEFVNATREELISTHHVADRDFRLLVRPSGTEPVIRIMVESTDGAFVDEFVARMHERFQLAS
jgi:phosphoglucosamine mutase